MKSTWKRFKPGYLLYAVVFVVFVIYAVSLVYPLVWAFLNSLKTQLEYSNHPAGLPEQWLFRNYIEAFTAINLRTMRGQYVNMFGMLLNSLWLTVGGSSLGVIVSAMTSYVVAKYNFKICKFVYGLAIFIMIIPIVGSLPAQYLLYNQLGLKDSPLILVTYAGGFGFNFIILYGFFKSVSWSYAEAAFIDGASDLAVFIRIMLPQTVPALVSLFIIAAIGVWNDYMTPMLFLPNFPTLSSGLYWFKELMSNSGEGSYPIYFAGLLLSLIPIMALFVGFSETIMQNTVAGGLKG